MDEKDKKIHNLANEILSLKREIARLQGILDSVDIKYELSENENNNMPVSLAQDITVEQIDLFISLFHGRIDVYAKRFVSKAGNIGYAPACKNFWRYGICPKADKQKIKCYECPNSNWVHLTRRILKEHLKGEAENCIDVIGIYPLLSDQTCYFLVFDFDNHDKEKETNEGEGANTDNAWIDDVNTMREICKINGVDVLVERSRSGRGAHIWMFFEEAIPAILARKFGMALLTKGADLVNQKNFKSYDRMLPAQDKMPIGGFGNLIALPLQGQALRKGNSAFIDEDWNVITNSWDLMANVKKISKQYMEEKISEWTTAGILGVLVDDMSGESDETSKSAKRKPWKKKEQMVFSNEDVEGIVNITLANQIYIENHNIKPRGLNRLRRLAAFSNPMFYKNQAMGFSTYGIPRIIQCFCDTQEYVCLPRGCEDKLFELLKESDVQYKVTDCKQKGNAINVEFTGELYPEQQKAADRIVQYDYGILAAATGFGKTAIGAYLISKLKVNTLILVHNREIMKNWINDFDKFLQINEELLEYETKRGKRKRKSIVGKLYAGHNSLNGIIDVAMITSFGKRDEINPVIKDYGLVIMDECHHAGAQTHENVLKEVNAKYVYGLTATPKREDGQEQRVFMQFGPIRYRLSAKDRAKMQDFSYHVYPRFTSLVNISSEKWGINDAYRALVSDDRRNKQIIDDVLECVANNRTPLVLTKFKEHAGLLVKMLEGKVQHLFSNRDLDSSSSTTKASHIVGCFCFKYRKKCQKHLFSEHRFITSWTHTTINPFCFSVYYLFF